MIRFISRCSKMPAPKSYSGGLSYDDAEILVKNVFPGQLDLEKWKEGLKRPVVTRYDRTWFENYFVTEQHARRRPHNNQRRGRGLGRLANQLSKRKRNTRRCFFWAADKVVTTGRNHQRHKPIFFFLLVGSDNRVLVRDRRGKPGRKRRIRTSA